MWWAISSFVEFQYWEQNTWGWQRQIALCFIGYTIPACGEGDGLIL
jgi:hypothetical protein